MTKLPATTSALVANLKKARTTIASNSEGSGAFLRLLKSGDWVFGSDDVEVDEDARWAVNPNSFMQGFICWGDSSDVLGEEMVPSGDDPVIKSNLSTFAPIPQGDGEPDFVPKWAQQVSVALACIEGDNEGQQVLYKTTSHGGIRALQDLLDQLISQITTGAEEIVPIVVLGSDSYKHKKWGRITTPVIDVDSWVTVDEIAPPERDEDDEEDEEEEEAPKQKRTRSKSKSKAKAKKAKAEDVDDEDEGDDAEVEEEEDEEEAPAPRRRRRRRTS